jgi:glycoprotein-N-acetylgalactosamine 3-beta-galactosyltransferase
MNSKNQIATLLLGFAFLWLSVVIYIYSSLSSSSTTHLDGRQLQLHHGVVPPPPPKPSPSVVVVVESSSSSSKQQLLNSTNKNINNNPWYGWQPPIATQMKCSWRACLKDGHTCNTCRDGLKEWGDAPQAPNDDNNEWIPDVTMLKRMYLEGVDSTGNPWPPPLTNADDAELCEPIGPSGGKYDDNLKLISGVPIQAERFSYQGPKILCLVYTMEKIHHTNIRAIRETWGPGCDGFLAFSTKSDPRIPAISIPHDGAEEYNNMWQKVRSIWRFVGKHYLMDFDFFYIGGEDMYVLPQNLRNYLSNVDKTKDHFLGRRFLGYGDKDNYFNSGGAGYVLSRPTLQKFYETGLDHPRCNPNRHTPMEDVMVAECLRHVFDIGIEDTRDEVGRERFHPFSPGSHLTWRPPPPGASKDWYEEYNKEWGLKTGMECCAPDSVSFHYIKKPTMMRHLHKLLYGGCDVS